MANYHRRGRSKAEKLTIGGSDDASTIDRGLSDFESLLLPAAVRAGDPRPPQTNVSFLAEPAPIVSPHHPFENDHPAENETRDVQVSATRHSATNVGRWRGGQCVDFPPHPQNT
jgi:hypothetical protein